MRVRKDNILEDQPVSATALPLPTGAATAAAQLPNNHNVVVTSAPTTAVTGTFWQATQPVSGTVTATAQPGVDIGDVTINNASGASAVNIQDGGNSLTVDGTVAISNLPATADTNFGAVGASTLRTAAQIGNATGAANFGAGATGAQTLRAEANQGAPRGGG